MTISLHKERAAKNLNTSHDRKLKRIKKIINVGRQLAVISTEMQPIEHEADLLERVAYFKKIKLSELTSAILTCFTIRACLSLGIPQIRKYMKRLLNTLRRGTTGKQKGVILLKDLAYFQGQESVWKSFEDVHTEADLDLLLAGKLDITKLDHKRIAEMILQKNN